MTRLLYYRFQWSRIVETRSKGAFMPGYKRKVTVTVGNATRSRKVVITTGDKTQTIQIKTTDPEIKKLVLRINDPKKFFDAEGKDVSPRYGSVQALINEIDHKLGGHG